MILWTLSKLLLRSIICVHLEHHLCSTPTQVEAVRIVRDVVHADIVVEMAVKEPATLHFERLKDRRVFTII